MIPPSRVVIFDLGGVLIDWDPRYLYRQLFAEDEGAMQRFLMTVCTPEWNKILDSGVSFADAARPLKVAHPDKIELIDAYLSRFGEMMPKPIDGSVELLAELDSRAIPLYALTNFSSDTFPVALRRFEFLQRFKGIVVSGDEKVAKPDAGIYQILLSRFGIDPASAIFIDDRPENIRAACQLGMTGIHFKTAATLRLELHKLGLLTAANTETQQPRSPRAPPR